MLAIVAAIPFAIAFILNATGTATSAIFDVTSILLVGLALSRRAGRLCGEGTLWWRSSSVCARVTVRSAQHRGAGATDPCVGVPVAYRPRRAAAPGRPVQPV